MNNKDYILDFRLKDIQTENCKQLVDFIVIRDRWSELYRKYGVTYPATSDNNFRDSWFHYRKIYRERDEEQLACQLANFEEHLQRAERDLAVKFFQDISFCLEQWYRLGLQEKNMTTVKCERIVESFINQTDFVNENNRMDCGWVISLNTICQKENCTVLEFSEIVKSVFKQYVWCEDIRKGIQNILHDIKNIVLDIRLSGSEIYRTEHIGVVTRQCFKVIDEFERFVDNCCLREIIFLGI